MRAGVGDHKGQETLKEGQAYSVKGGGDQAHQDQGNQQPGNRKNCSRDGSDIAVG